MTYLSEDPTYVVGALAVLAGAFLMALKVTQQGKYLVWVLSTLGLALAVVVIEYVWVTDNERIEAVVYNLKRAVVALDVDGVLRHMTPDVEYVQGRAVLPGEVTQGLIRANLANTTFDFIHIQDLQISAGRQTRRGKAEFRVYAKGTLRTSLAPYNMGTANSTWSLGFQETSPGTWKVNRITPVSVPEGAIYVPSLSSSYGIRSSSEVRQRVPGPTLLESRKLRAAGANATSPRHPVAVPLPPRRDELR